MEPAFKYGSSTLHQCFGDCVSQGLSGMLWGCGWWRGIGGIRGSPGGSASVSRNWTAFLQEAVLSMQTYTILSLGGLSPAVFWAWFAFAYWTTFRSIKTSLLSPFRCCPVPYGPSSWSVSSISVPSPACCIPGTLDPVRVDIKIYRLGFLPRYPLLLLLWPFRGQF